MMNPEIKALWLDALRSGEYEQGQGYLHRETEDGKHVYCCLGVLCELAVKAGVLSEPSRRDYSHGDLALHEYAYEVAVLPKAVRRWAGLEGGTGWYMGEEGGFRTFEVEGRSNQTALTQVNDDFPVDGFVRVADVIERLY